MSVDPESFWDENFYNHPPLTETMVASAESALGVRLPDELIALLRVQNGGYTKGFAFPMLRRTSWAEDHVPLTELFGIVTDPSIRSAQNILDTAYMTKEWGLPPRQVLLCGDGHWWLTLDYRVSGRPRVAWLDCEIGEDIPIAPAFPEFLNGLVPLERFTGAA